MNKKYTIIFKFFTFPIVIVTILILSMKIVPAQNLLTTIGKGKWMVIRQTGEDSFCYIKQENELMDLSIQNANRGSKDIDTRFPTITHSFLRGLKGEIVYWVDNGPKKIINVKDLPTDITFNLSESIIPELKRGMILTVRVKPKWKKQQEQKFDLRGFTSALSWLGKECCNLKETGLFDKTVILQKEAYETDNVIKFLQNANFKAKCGCDTTSVKENLEFFKSVAAINNLRWSINNKGNNKYQVILNYIDAGAGPQKAIWSVDMQNKYADFNNTHAKTFSCMPQ